MSSPRRHDSDSIHPQHAVSKTPTDSPHSRKAILLITAIGAFVLVVFVAVRSLLGNGEEHTVVRFGRTQPIQLDVLNGTTEAKLAQRVTDYLRSRGFDVVEMGNYKSSSVESTLVLDRTGNIEAAREVAQALGVPETNVRSSIDKTLFLDVSVIVGSDLKHLKSR